MSDFLPWGPFHSLSVDAVSVDEDLVSRVNRLRGSLLHENVQIALHAASHIRRLLDTHSQVIYGFILQENVHPVINGLFHDLLFTLKKLSTLDAGIQAQELLHQPQQGVLLRRMVCSCLGALGAIDPGKLAPPLSTTSSTTTASTTTAIPFLPLDNYFANSLKVSQFGSVLVGSLLFPTLISAVDTRAQDLTSFVIQEMLKTCNVTADDLSEPPVGRSTFTK